MTMRLVGADIVCSAIYGAETVLLLLLSRDLGLGDHGYGYLLASFGLGGVLGAGVGRARWPPTSARASCSSAPWPCSRACTALLADPFGVGGALALGVVSGAGCIVVEVLVETGLQRSLAPDVFARAYGFAYPAAIAGIVAGSLDRRPARRALRRPRRVRGARRAHRRLHADPAAPPARRRWRRRPRPPRPSRSAR